MTYSCSYFMVCIVLWTWWPYNSPLYPLGDVTCVTMAAIMSSTQLTYYCLYVPCEFWINVVGTYFLWGNCESPWNPVVHQTKMCFWWKNWVSVFWFIFWWYVLIVCCVSNSRCKYTTKLLQIFLVSFFTATNKWKFVAQNLQNFQLIIMPCLNLSIFLL